MADQVLTEVEVFRPATCQVASHADEERSVTEVARQRFGADDDRVVEEFTLVGEPGENELATDVDAAVEQAFEFEDRAIYRLERDPAQGCLCERIERTGSVVHEFHVEGERVRLTFLSPDIETLRGIIAGLRSTAECVRLRRLLEEGADADARRPVVLDRATLTDRQLTVLEVANEMGYFEHPRDATAGEVAAELDIATSTFTEHLAASQRKLLDALLTD